MATTEKIGRPSKWSESMEDKILYWASRGYKESLICQECGINMQTLANWKKKYPVFFESLKDAKQIMNNRVESSLLQRARGYKLRKTVLAQHQGIFTDEQEVIENLPPDVRAAETWLNNRNPNRWRNKQVTEIENAGDILREVVKMFGEH